MATTTIRLAKLSPGEWEACHHGRTPHDLEDVWFPSLQDTVRTFFDWIARSGVPSVELDFAGWMALINKQQLLDYIEFAYGTNPSYVDPKHILRWRGKAYEVDTLNTLRDHVNALPADGSYGLVLYYD